MPEMTENILPGMIPEKINPDSFDLDEAERYLIGDTIGHETTAHDERNRGALLSQRKQRLLRYVEENTIGHRSEFVGPYGRKRAIYCDYTASGRPVNFIEDYIRDHVHPLYANTHTITGVMARQTTRFRHEARELIKKYVNASNDDVLIFTGSGTTAAVHKLLHAINLRGEKAQHTVVFVGPFEHHSNILPWKEAGAAIVRIRATDDGIFDVSHLEEELKNYTQKKRYRIGCFCAASNVTGIITDTNHVTALLHKYGALAFWDFATAGPYMRIDMNPPTTHDGLDCSKDAVYLSPHKFIGGVGTPGILLAKKKLFTNSVPSQCGGGTVLYVTRNTHFYLRNIEDKEEGGTPAIVESIRAGLAFKLKQAIGTDAIMAREVELVKTALETWKNNPNIIILGSTEAERLPIFSFIIFHPESGKLLHHNFIAVLLNDLYGIQARGGCACAGPYAQDLLGISEELAEKFIYYLLDEEDIRLSKLTKFATTEGKVSLEILKPGFLRLNLPFFFSDELIAYVLLAVDQIAKYGWKLLPQYAPNIVSGNWEFIGKKSYSDDCIITEDDSLHTITFKDGHFTAPNSPYTGSQLANVEYHQLQGEYLDMARLELAIFSQKKLTLSSFEVENFSSDTKRRIEALLKPGIGGSSTGGSLLRRYSQATACLSSDNCFTLDPDLSRIMAKSRDYDQLYWAWNSWRDVAGRPSRDDFILEVESNNHNSISYGFTDTSDHWRSAYEVDDIAEQVNKLYADLAPLYTQLHAYVRRKLYNYYGPDYINLEGPIPAHLLGNMWAQSWINIFDIVQPYPVNSTVDLTAAIRKKYFNGEELFRAAEDFFLSLGMLKASKSFWEESLFERPQDGRKVVCHGTAWDFQNQEDLRISMCADLTLVDFIIAHHEMGHIQYYMQYVDQPFEFRQGANPGFHEAVGDVIALSASTPEYHRNIGLIDEIEDNEEADINFLMRQALDKIAFLPFSFLVDTWRWGVFNGSIPPEKYNTKWWEFREKFQGVQPPTPRTEEHFDPAAKYHISAGTPYLRYFVSTVTQFQFHQALCDAAGHVGPLFKCNLHNSTEAGKLFSEMLQFGSSQHWTNAMETITGQTEMKSDALVEYFKPLTEWLEKQNENETIGWDRAHRWYPQAPDPWYGGASVMQHSAYLLMTCVLLNSLFT